MILSSGTTAAGICLSSQFEVEGQNLFNYLSSFGRWAEVCSWFTLIITGYNSIILNLLTPLG